MATIIVATYDGNVFRPAGPVSLEPNTSVRLTFEPLLPASGDAATAGYAAADFYKPVAFHWSELEFTVDQARESYSGKSHADR